MNTKEFHKKNLGGINIYTIETYKDIQELINSGEIVRDNALKSLLDIQEYLEGQGKPKGYSTGTSYVDADTIHGSRGESHADTYQRLVNAAASLNNMVIVQEKALERYYKIKEEVDKCLYGNMDIGTKVSILREQFTQEQVAELIGKGIRTVQRIEKQNKIKNVV